MMLWKMNGRPEVSGKNPFKDVTGKKTIKAILWALNEGIIVSGKTFDPEGEISRAQIVMMLWKMSGSPSDTGTSPFTDVKGFRHRFQRERLLEMLPHVLDRLVGGAM